MFGLFKTSATKRAQKLQKDYEAKLSQAMQAQRNGDLRRYASLSEEAEKILSQIRALS